MSQNHFREDTKTNPSKNLPVVSKCLVIVLIPKSRQKSEDVSNEDADSTVIESNNGEVLRPPDILKASRPNANPPNGYNGKELLQDFKTKNKTCYWNPSLVESIKSLEYKGFVEPFTILVTAADIHLENLRSAWGRRVLKAPSGFTIERIGDVNGIEMQVIPQTQFMPLPDAICNVLLDLNTRGLTATLDVILEKLALWYRHMNVPSQQLVFDSLGQLIKDRKVFHTGSGYFVVTPDTSRLQTSWAANSTYVPSNASWLPYHPMYVPVFQGQMAASPHLQASRAHMRSISCQVTTIEGSGDEEDVTVHADKENGKISTLGKAPRSSSLGRNKDGNKGKKTGGKSETGPGHFKRTGSLKEEKSKGGKEVPLKVNNPPAEKEKEKTSIFSKIFGRKKKDRDKLLMPPPSAPPPLKHPPVPPSSTSGSDVYSEGREPKEKEYATFSAQFPPPEWMWYQQQLEKQKRTENWVTHQSSTASTTIGVSRASNLPGSKVTSRPPVPIKMPHHYASSHRKSLVSLHHGHENYVSMGAVHIQGNGAQSIRADNLYESFRNPLPPPLPKSRDHHHRKSKDFDSHRAPVSLQHPRQEHRQPEYDVVDNPGDVTPLHTSNVYHSVSALSPVTPFNDNNSSTYAKLTKQQPQLGPLHSTPRVNLTGQTERATYGVEGHEARDRIYGPASHGHHRHKGSKSHRSRRKAQRIYSYYTGGGGAGSDISYEYKGKLPNKNSSRAQSRDSGVNCVGLGKAKGQTDPVYQNTGKSEPKQNLQDQKLSPPIHVRFERSVGGGAEGESVSCPGNSALGGDMTNHAYNSVIYAGDSTNQAYNSVIFGSMMEGEAAPSVMYGTIATSHIDSTAVALQKDSLQSGYYNDDEDSSIPAAALIRCQVEINPTALTQGGEELQSSPESIVDIEGQASPSGIREVSGSSDGVVELAGGDRQDEEGEDSESSDDEENARLTQYFGRTGVGHDGDDEETEEDGDSPYIKCGPPRHNSFSEQTAEALHMKDNSLKFVKDQGIPAQSDRNHADQLISKTQTAPTTSTTKPSSSEISSLNRVPASREHFVSNSGFNFPSNPEGAASSGHPITSFGRGGKPSWALSVPYHQLQVAEEETVGSSDGHHTNSSDVNMASSEHHSGSTTNGDSSCETHPYIYTKVLSQSHHSIPPPPHQGPSVHYIASQQHKPHTAIHMYQPVARVVPHPDVYNNNNNSNFIANSNGTVPLHPNTAVLNSQSPVQLESKGKLSDRDLWKQNNAPHDRHKFEEEQRSKKYGVNGEFEVMGVL